MLRSTLDPQLDHSKINGTHTPVILKMKKVKVQNILSIFGNQKQIEKATSLDGKSCIKLENQRM